MKALKQFLFFSICLLISNLCLAKTPDLPELTPENFNQEYTRVATSLLSIEETFSRRLIKQFKHAKGNHHFKLTKKQTIAKNDYQKLTTQLNDIKPINDLKEDLLALYTKHFTLSKTEHEALTQEATMLALGIFNETKRLEDKYGTFILPVIHNMLIDIRLKKRGACKHWAEDLLEFLKPIQRKFFDVTWGEAYPGLILEHNTAVLIPKGRPFEDGLYIDPWRTSGRLYWQRVPEDHHYPWKQWPKYGRF
ncbi:MAG: hypothetical protein ABII18_03970 [bacterium]|nr:hypothetical protein [bacterium]MBU1917936.1 hypothetical protein [bacterium]